MKKVIVVFDGFCVLCNNYTSWLSKNNTDKNIYFTNFESKYIKDRYPKLKLGNTVIVINEKNDIKISFCVYWNDKFIFFT